MIYQCEKSLGELGDKVSAEEKSEMEAGINKLKETLKGTDSDAIKADTDALQQSFYKIAEKLYAQQQAAGQAPQDGTVPPQDGKDDNGADYTVIDDDNK